MEVHLGATRHSLHRMWAGLPGTGSQTPDVEVYRTQMVCRWHEHPVPPLLDGAEEDFEGLMVTVVLAWQTQGTHVNKGSGWCSTRALGP